MEGTDGIRQQETLKISHMCQKRSFDLLHRGFLWLSLVGTIPSSTLPLTQLSCAYLSNITRPLQVGDLLNPRSESLALRSTTNKKGTLTGHIVTPLRSTLMGDRHFNPPLFPFTAQFRFLHLSDEAFGDASSEGDPTCMRFVGRS